MSNEINMAKLETESRDAAIAAAQDLCKSKSITAGLTGLQHARILFHWVEEQGLLADASKEEKLTLLFGFCELENGSALRQKLEKKGTLAATSKAASIVDDI